MNVDLAGQCALVTGASRGIGAAIARRFGASGATVVAHYCSDEEGARTAIAGAPAGSIALGADLADAESARGLFARAVERVGAIDVVVNNAGIALSAPIGKSFSRWLEHWNRTIDVNLRGAAILAREAVLHFSAREGGRIIFIASRAAFRGDTEDYIPYAASKSGMVAVSRTIARRFGKKGVKSFVVAPGFTRTRMAQQFIDEYGERLAVSDIALDRMTEPDDIAPLVTLLASGLADHATGCSIDVNAASYVR